MSNYNNGIIISFFNSNNLGDILISETLYKEYKEYFDNLKKCSFEGSFDIENRTTKTSLRKYKLFNRVHSSIENRVKNYNFRRKYIEEIKKTDFLVIGGGNMLMSLSKKDTAIKNFIFFVEQALKYNVKVIVPSIGIGPFYSNKDLVSVQKILLKCDIVTYRDKNSRDLILHGKKFENHLLTVDPVFKLPLYQEKKINTKYNKVGVGAINTLLFNDSTLYYEKVKMNYLKLIRQLLSEEKEVYLYSTEKADEKMLIDLENIIKNENFKVIYLNSIKDLMTLYEENLDYIIAARMHSLIVGFTQHIPIIGLSWQKKVNNFFKVINQENRVFELEFLGEETENIIEILNTEEKYNEEKYINQLESISNQYVSFDEIEHLIK